jgi:hypothetical protein
MADILKLESRINIIFVVLIVMFIVLGYLMMTKEPFEHLDVTSGSGDSYLWNNMTSDVTIGGNIRLASTSSITVGNIVISADNIVAGNSATGGVFDKNGMTFGNTTLTTVGGLKVGTTQITDTTGNIIAPLASNITYNPVSLSIGGTRINADGSITSNSTIQVNSLLFNNGAKFNAYADGHLELGYNLTGNNANNVVLYYALDGTVRRNMGSTMTQVSGNVASGTVAIGNVVSGTMAGGSVVIPATITTMEQFINGTSPPGLASFIGTNFFSPNTKAGTAPTSVELTNLATFLTNNRTLMNTFLNYSAFSTSFTLASNKSDTFFGNSIMQSLVTNNTLTINPFTTNTLPATYILTANPLEAITGGSATSQANTSIRTILSSCSSLSAADKPFIFKALKTLTGANAFTSF